MAMMGWYGHGGFGWGGWLLMTLMMLIFWGAVVVAAIALWRSALRNQPSSTPEARRDAIQLLDERLARGEIEPDDYTHRRQLLGSGK
jgi:putative membrane protein